MIEGGPGDHYLITKNKEHVSRLVWTIENVLRFPAEKGKYIESHPISPPCESCGVKWVVRLWPRGENSDSVNYISLRVSLIEISDEVQLPLALIDLAVIGKDGKKVKIFNNRNVDFVGVEVLKRGFGWGKLLKISDLRDKKSDWLPDGHLTLETVVTAHLRLKKDNACFIPVSTLAETQSKLWSTMVKKLYQEELCSDVVLKASDKQFKCHKNILSARSKYFKAMFEHQMREREENEVDLSHQMNGKELRDLLDFIYLGTKPYNLRKTCLKLYEVADMYGLDDLKRLSEETLTEQINAENALDMLEFADRHECKKLKRVAAYCVAKSVDFQ